MAARAQIAYTATHVGDEAVLATAIVGVPGLAIVWRLGTFCTGMQANEYAERLNAELGVTPSQSRTIVTDAMLKADELINECESLRQKAKELHQSQPKLEFLRAQLELGATFCHMACTRADMPKERALRNAHLALSNAMNAIGRSEFSVEGTGRVRAGIDHLQNALDECAARMAELGHDD